MFEQEDDGTRIGLWAVLGIIVLVIFGVVGGIVLRHFGGSGAAAAPAGARASMSEVVLIEGPLAGDLIGTVYFGSGQSALPPEAGAEIDKLVQAMLGAPGRRVVLSGFHDDSGDPAKNAELAKQRALAARAALLQAGVAADRIALRKPEVTTGSGTDREARRVEMRLVD